MLQVSSEPRIERIGCLNWPEAFPYAPEAAVEISHTGALLQLHFRVREAAVRAVCEADGGRAWEDSCVEFFFAPREDGIYYNLECTCTGRICLCRGAGRHGANRSSERPAGHPPPLYAGRSPFGLRSRPTAWEVGLDIPAAVFGLESFDGLHARGNFYKCGDGLPVPHYLSWAPVATPRPDFHRPEFFERMEFV